MSFFLQSAAKKSGVKTAAVSTSAPSVSGLHIRLQREAEEAKMLETDFTKISFPDVKTLQSMVVVIKPAEGYYSGGSFEFSVDIPDDYPYHPPKAVCLTDVCIHICF
jgi:ubiquitin-protein ligase